MRTTSALFIAIIILLISSLPSPAQDTNKYQGLLWKITGNGLEKPSYLFGTMHVSKKVAFYLNEEFFEGVNSCDMIALEQDPSEMLENYIDFANKRTASDTRIMGYQFSSFFYDIAFDIVYPSNIQIGRFLAEDYEMVNSLLYRRSGGYSDNFREDTYLDLFLYQVGRKLGKEVINLEEFEKSLEMVMRASIPEKDPTPSHIREFIKNLEPGQTIYDVLEDSYRKGNLDLMDSVQTLMNPSKTYRKWMLTERNIIMFNKLDSLLKTKSVFTGVGAAHLPGDDGLIVLLRNAGYTVESTEKTISEESKEYKKKLEEQHFEHNYSTFFAFDSTFKYTTPAEMIEMPADEGIIQLLHADVTNGAFYSAARLKTYGNFFGEDIELMKKRVDSLFYENIPGEITEQKDTLIDGMQIFEITNKLLRGDYQKYKIYILPYEIVFFKMSGPKEYVNKHGGRFFNSIEFTKKSNPDWRKYQYPYQGFVIEMPGYNFSEFDAKQKDDLDYMEMLASDISGEELFLLRKARLYDINYFEDTDFELTYIPEVFADKLDADLDTVFIENYGIYPGSFAKITKDSVIEIKTRLVLRNNEYFFLATDSKDQAKIDRFFNSLSFSEIKYEEEFIEHVDTLLHFTAMSVPQPDNLNTFMEISEQMGGRYKKDYNTIEKDLIIYSPGANERISVSYYQYPKYSSMDSTEQFFGEIRDTLWARKYIIRDSLYQEDGDVYSLDIHFNRKNSFNQLRAKYILKNSVLYTISYYGDTLTPESKFVTEFYNTFTPADTVIGGDLFESKADLFFESINSKDSTEKDHAQNSIHKVKFRDEDIPKLLELIEYLDVKEDAIDKREDLIIELRFLDLKDHLDDIEDLYIKLMDTSNLQFYILSSLAKQRTEESTELILDLLEEDTPLSNSSSQVYGFIRYYVDTLELAKKLFPRIMDYAQYPEYKDPIHSLLAEMKYRGVITKEFYDKQKKLILRDARNKQKRSFSSDGNKERYRDDEYSAFYYASDKEDYHNILHSYAILLEPYHDDSPFDIYFEKILSTHDLVLKSNLLRFYIQNDIPYQDSLLYQIAKDDDYRVYFYDILDSLGRLDLFPDEFKNQREMAKAWIDKGYDEDSEDSIVFHSLEYAEAKKDSGNVYFFRQYDKSKNSWSLVAIAFQPTDTNEVSTDLYFYDDKKLDGREIEDVKEEFLEEIRLHSRPRAGKRKSYGGYYY